MTSNRTLALALALGLALAAGPASASWWSAHIATNNGPLHHANGQKLVTGFGNKLHLVFQSGGSILHSMSSDGLTWSSPTALFCGSPGRLPAIAADTSGYLAVVWVDNATSSLQYVYHDGTSWSMPVTVVADGDEPSIVARAGQVHLAWRTAAADRIRYTSFPIGSPSLVTNFETVDVTSCSTDRYRYPSITLSLANATITPVIGYLYSRTAPCMTGSTIGPRVCKRDNNLNTWSLTWQDQRTDNSSTSVQPVSLSMSSRVSSAELFVAYSDVQSSIARTKLGHGLGTTWAWATPEVIDSQARHIHVRASESGTAIGTFRLAREGVSAYNTQYRDGVWAGAAVAPTWSTSWTNNSGPPVTQPHAHWWGRCAGGTVTDVRLVAYEDLCLCIPAVPRRIGFEYGQTSPCPPPVIVSTGNVQLTSVAVATARFVSPGSDVPETVVEVLEGGVVLKTWDGGAAIGTETGEVIEVGWDGGELIASSDTTLTLTAPAESIRFQGDVFFTLDDLGTFSGFDHSPAGEQCSGIDRP